MEIYFHTSFAGGILTLGEWGNRIQYMQELKRVSSTLSSKSDCLMEVSLES